MKKGDYNWDNKNELRTRCELSLRFPSGHIFYNAGKKPIACATLMPDGKTLDITIFTDRIPKEIHYKG